MDVNKLGDVEIKLDALLVRFEVEILIADVVIRMGLALLVNRLLLCFTECGSC